VYLGFIIGIAGGLGFAGGGWVADRLGRRSQKYALWGVAGAMLAGWLFLVPVYLVGDPHVALAFFVIPTVLSNFYLATTFAQIQGLVKLRMRAVASALLLFILNIIGLGLGPQLTGILSDQLAPGLGTESMRYSLLIVACVVSPWAAWHYFAAGHHIEADLARAEEP
jgi:MFS family permease